MYGPLWTIAHASFRVSYIVRRGIGCWLIVLAAKGWDVSRQCFVCVYKYIYVNTYVHKEIIFIKYVCKYTF